MGDRATEQTHGKQQGGHAPAHDDDSSHSGRRHADQDAGDAAVRRMAGPAGSPAKDAKDQHEKAELTSFQALMPSVQLAARHLFDAANALTTLMKAPTGDGGSAQKADIVHRQFDHLYGELSRLYGELSAAPNSYLRTLSEDLRHLNGAFNKYREAFQSAKRHLESDGQQSTDNPEWIRQVLEGMHEKAGLKMEDVGGVGDDLKSEKELLSGAIADNVTAAQDSAQSVRLNLKSGNDDVALTDLRRLGAHVRELAAELKGVDSKAIKPHQKALLKLVHDVEALEGEAAGKPKLGESLKNGDLQFQLDTIKHAAGGK